MVFIGLRLLSISFLFVDRFQQLIPQGHLTSLTPAMTSLHQAHQFESATLFFLVIFFPYFDDVVNGVFYKSIDFSQTC